MAIDKRIPIYRFVVGEDDEAGVTAVALVDNPAIEMNWQAFNSQVNIILCKNCGHSWDVKDGGEDPYMCKCGTYNDEFVIEPKENESEDEFISRCIGVEVGNGYDQDQAAAICYSKWDKQKFAETYNDYPKKASENAQAALNYAEKNGWGSCGTDVGKQRANQLAKGENISRETIARMAAFERHRQNSQKELGDGCGRLMWLAWGGDEGIEWAQRKLKQIDQKMSKFSSNKEKRIVSGPLMVSNLPIYRKDEQGEYYGLFTAEDIYNIRNKFFKNNNTKSVNEMHDPNKMIEGVYMIESFIIDSKRGINAPDGLKLTDGSWFGSYKVDNEDIWNDFIKTGEFKGFSVEGVFKTTKIDSKPLSIIEQAIDIIKQIED
jgi:hypothetical protein